jgi:hypothetical protein
LEKLLGLHHWENEATYACSGSDTRATTTCAGSDAD